MSTTTTNPDSTELPATDARDCSERPERGHHGHHGRGGPRGMGFGRRGGFGPAFGPGFGPSAGPTIVIQTGAPQGFGPRAGFGPGPAFGPGHAPAFGPFAGGKRPKKADIRLMKRVRRIAIELGKYRGTATADQRAQAQAKLDETVAEIKRILAS